MKYQAYPDHKDSGVEWLDSVPIHWTSVPIKYMALETGTLFLDGDWIESKDLSDDGIRYITTGNVGEGNYKEQGGGYITEDKFIEIDCTEVFEGDVLISRLNAPIGRACIVPNLESKIVTSVDNVIFRPDHHYCKNYIVYLFSSEAYFKHTGNLARGATMQRISRGLLGNIRVVVPSTEEQTKIANFLDHETAKIDTLIEQQQQLIKLLKEKRQAVISHAVTKGLNPNAPMRDSGVEWLGEVPEHWEIPKIGHCAFVTKLTGFEYTNLWRTSEDGEIIALRGFNVKDGKLDLYKAERISVDLSKKLARSKLSKGDIVFPCTGTIGNAALIENDDKFHINQNIAKISFEGKVSPKFAVYWLTSSFVRTLIDRNNMSGMQPVVLIGDIRKLPIPGMSLEEQDLITGYLDIQISKFNKIIGSGEQAIELMQERRAALISAAVTGKIDVRDWNGDST